MAGADGKGRVISRRWCERSWGSGQIIQGLWAILRTLGFFSERHKKPLEGFEGEECNDLTYTWKESTPTGVKNKFGQGGGSRGDEK